MRGQKQFKNRLPYSAGTASAYLNYPQRPFHLWASPALPATPVVFAVWSAHDVNFVRFAMLKNVVGFVVIRQNALSPLPTPRSRAGSGETFRSADSFVAICLLNTFSDVDTPLRGVSTLLGPERCALIFPSQCPTPLCGVGHWGGGEKLGVRGQKRFKNRLPYSAGTASAFLNYPQRPFHLRASPALPATPVVFAVWSAHDVNFVRFAMLKNIVGFVIIR